jgi:hypothetical protein
MNNIGQINDRQIIYLSIKETVNWADLLPSGNWLVLPISDTRDKELLDKIANACLDNKVNYICTVGPECEWIHDWFDQTIFVRRIENGQPISTPDDFDEEPMTTWHHDFDEGFWFAITSAYPTINSEYITIDKVVCLDMTEKGEKQRLIDLVIKINSGWIPLDN